MSNYSLKNIESIANGDDTFVDSIVDAFKTSFAIYQKETTAAVVRNDWERIKFLAHQIKPSIDLFEITAIRKTIRDLEAECVKETIDISLISSLNTQVIDEVSRVINEMDERD